jgi:heme-degrading monooxygenase HmoA
MAEVSTLQREGESAETVRKTVALKGAHIMFVIANRFKVNPGYEGAFEQRFRHRAHLVEGMPGFVKWELHRPVGDGWYASVTYWESREHHEAWRRSEAFATAHRDTPPPGMFAAPNVLEMTEVALSSYPTQAFTEALRQLHGDGREVTR